LQHRFAKQALLTGKDLDKKLLEGKLFIFRRLFKHGLMEKQKLQAILAFLDNYIQFENKETNRIFKERVDELTGKQNTMDIFEILAQWKLEDAREDAREEQKEEFARKLLANLKLPVEDIAAITEIPISEINNLKAEVIR
jgi:hypothetical protein